MGSVLPGQEEEDQDSRWCLQPWAAEAGGQSGLRGQDTGGPDAGIFAHADGHPSCFSHQIRRPAQITN